MDGGFIRKNRHRSHHAANCQYCHIARASACIAAPVNSTCTASTHSDAVYHSTPHLGLCTGAAACCRFNLQTARHLLTPLKAPRPKLAYGASGTLCNVLGVATQSLSIRLPGLPSFLWLCNLRVHQSIWGCGATSSCRQN